MTLYTHNQPLELLRAFVRYKTHAGYTWGLVLADGGMLCETCAKENYRQVFTETKNGGKFNQGWQAIGLTNSGEAEETEYCSHCNKTLWDKADA
jgi:hypothetical protein